MADLGTLTVSFGANFRALQSAQQNMMKILRELDKKVEQTNARLNSMGSGVTGATDKIKKNVKSLTPALQEPFRLFSKSAVAHLATVSQQFRTIGYLFSAAVTAPIVLATKSVAKMAMEYEFSMQKIVGLTGTAQGVVNQWSDAIQNMSRDFGRKPQELAEGLYFIASSGIEGAEALEVLKMSAKAAASGLGETQDVANYLTSVLNAYRGTGLTAAYATDVLVAAVREGKAEAQGFAAAMGSITPIASNLGVSIDQVAGAMAAITLTGSTAAQSATYLRGVFNVLLKETEQGATAMDEASAALGQMETSYADLRKILREQGIIALMEKLNELTGAYGETLVSKVFPNIRAMLGVLSLSGKNMEYNSKIIKEITNSQGSLGKAFNAVADTIKMRYDKAISSLQFSMINIGKAVATGLIPLLESLSRWIEKVADWYNGLTDAQKKNKLIMVGVLAAIGPVSMALSVLGYTLTYAMRAVNLFTAALGGLNTMLSLVGITSAKAGAKFALLRKVVSVKNLFGSVSKFVKNPYVLIAAGAVTATVAVGKYAKKIKEIAAENELFNTAQVKVNGAVKDFKTLLQSDIEVMSFDELMANMDMALKVMEQVQTLRDQYTKNLEMPLQSNRKNKRLIEEQNKKLEETETIYGQIKQAILAYYAAQDAKKLQDEIDNQNKAKEAIKEHNKALQDLLKSTQEEVSSLNVKAKIYEALGKPFELAEEQASVLFKAIETLIGKDYNLQFEAPEIQSLMKQIEELGINYTELGKATNKYNAELAAINMKSMLLGSTFDAEAAKLDLAQKTLDEFIEGLSKFGDIDILTSLGPTMSLVGTNLKLIIEGLVQQIENYKRAIDTREDEKQLKVLQMEADAFGNLAGKIEVVNYALQAAQRDLRNMFSANAEKKGLIFSEDEIKKTVKRIQTLRTELVALQNAQELTWLTDMDNALRTADTGASLLQGRITALENTLKTMSENGQGAGVAFKLLAEEMQTLLYAQKGVDILSSAFTDLFTSVIDGSKNMGEVLKGIFNQVINQIIQMIAQMMAMRIIMMIIGAAAGGPIGAMSTANLTIPRLAPSLPGLQEFAKGGIVPPGYPNDSFPARLTSGEAIIPLNQLDKYDFGQTVKLDADVRFEIEGDKLVAIIKKQGKRNSIY